MDFLALLLPFSLPSLRQRLLCPRAEPHPPRHHVEMLGLLLHLFASSLHPPRIHQQWHLAFLSLLIAKGGSCWDFGRDIRPWSIIGRMSQRKSRGRFLIRKEADLLYDYYCFVGTDPELPASIQFLRECSFLRECEFQQALASFAKCLILTSLNKAIPT